MSTKSIVISGLVLLVAAAAVAPAANAADLSIIKRDRSQAAARKSTPPAGAPDDMTVAVKLQDGDLSRAAMDAHVHAARGWFISARAAMERCMLTPETISRTALASLHGAMKEMRAELSMIGRHPK